MTNRVPSQSLTLVRPGIFTSSADTWNDCIQSACSGKGLHFRICQSCSRTFPQFLGHQLLLFLGKATASCGIVRRAPVTQRLRRSCCIPSKRLCTASNAAYGGMRSANRMFSLACRRKPRRHLERVSPAHLTPGKESAFFCRCRPRSRHDRRYQ